MPVSSPFQISATLVHPVERTRLLLDLQDGHRRGCTDRVAGGRRALAQDHRVHCHLRGRLQAPRVLPLLLQETVMD